MKTPATLVRINAALCDSFVAAADALARRRAGDIPEPTIDRLVAVRWLEWCGGSLRLTRLGEIVLMKVQAMALANARPA
jgi:hypothetical protein